MFTIYKNNNVIAITEKVTYIKKHPINDSYIPASEADATGVAVQSLSEVYALIGKELDNLEQVVIVESDSGTFFKNVGNQLKADIDYLASMTGVDMDV